MQSIGSIRQRFVNKLLLSIVLVVLMMCSSSAFGSIHISRDPRLGVLDADLVALLRPVDKDTFEVDEIYLGQAQLGDVVTLPGFKLVTEEDDAHSAHSVIDPFTPDTKILVYLAKTATGEYTVTVHGECYFWVQTPDKVNDLRTMALDSVAMRSSWEDARDTRDVKKRIDALWPFLWDHNIRFWERTSDELKKIGAPAGDYIADHLETMTSFQKDFFLGDLSEYGGRRAHLVLISFLKTSQAKFDTMLASEGLQPGGLSIDEKWNSLDKRTTDTYGEIYYGLSGLVKFKDRSDLPLIRNFAAWGTRNIIKQVCQAALIGFEHMPEKANLSYIAAISQMFTSHKRDGDGLIPYDVARVLIQHPYIETVPLLAPFLEDDFSNETVYQNLKRLTHQDLGREPAAWLEWYKKRSLKPETK